MESRGRYLAIETLRSPGKRQMHLAEWAPSRLRAKAPAARERIATRLVLQKAPDGLCLCRRRRLMARPDSTILRSDPIDSSRLDLARPEAGRNRFVDKYRPAGRLATVLTICGAEPALKLARRAS